MKPEFFSGKEIPEVDDVELAFGVGNLVNFPLYEEIPSEFKNFNNQTKWNKLMSDWFFVGLSSLELIPKEGVDKDKAMRYIRAHMKTWQSKHEHKEAGIAYCLSLWFTDAKWEKKNE